MMPQEVMHRQEKGERGSATPVLVHVHLGLSAQDRHVSSPLEMRVFYYLSSAGSRESDTQRGLKLNMIENKPWLKSDSMEAIEIKSL